MGAARRRLGRPLPRHAQRRARQMATGRRSPVPKPFASAPGTGSDRARCRPDAQSSASGSGGTTASSSTRFRSIPWRRRGPRSRSRSIRPASSRCPSGGETTASASSSPCRRSGCALKTLRCLGPSARMTYTCSCPSRSPVKTISRPSGHHAAAGILPRAAREPPFVRSGRVDDEDVGTGSVRVEAREEDAAAVRDHPAGCSSRACRSDEQACGRPVRRPMGFRSTQRISTYITSVLAGPYHAGATDQLARARWGTARELQVPLTAYCRASLADELRPGADLRDHPGRPRPSSTSSSTTRIRSASTSRPSFPSTTSAPWKTRAWSPSPSAYVFTSRATDDAVPGPRQHHPARDGAHVVRV